MLDVTLFQTVVQAGAFGLLAWIAIYWLPRASSRMADSYDKSVASFTAALADLARGFQEEQRYEREQCQRHFDALLDGQNKTLDMLKAHQEVAVNWMTTEQRRGKA